MPALIFVSYSHQDVDLVRPVVGLLRATEDLVFQDLDSIKPGSRWRREIEEALYAAQLFVLFWCYHSSRSAEVRKEYELALTTGKDVLPVLLDTTPLPQQLNEFQWVDFRHLGGSVHRSYRRWVTLIVVLVLIVGFSLFFAIKNVSLPLELRPPDKVYQPSKPSPPPPPDDRGGKAPPPDDRGERERPPAAALPVTVFALLAVLALFFATVWALATWMERQARRRQFSQYRSGTPTYSQRQMAEQIQVELFRRGIGSA